MPKVNFQLQRPGVIDNVQNARMTAIGKSLDGTAELDDAEDKEIQDAYSPFRR